MLGLYFPVKLPAATQGSIDFDILWPTGISEPMPWGGDVFFNFAKYFTSSSPLYDYQSANFLYALRSCIEVCHP
eukprot:jgi/Astpho2/6234/Aster-03640